ncbi:MAG: hypothetical protein IM553_14185 [Microcystis sp. M57BS1]|jgi:hypothetical protein|uniref:hypothetical protein n=1 Tax=unclassified Microcystis TaxID=2643300 RepID=UPI00258B33CE|nr:hypothetical protein [Microcystis sp. M57BS1]MCA2535522.1 hypothetical protein [Microcystis sp. M57BS1]MCA2597551.1 hypothetical protein [Microcystis sp. M38BS1]MCA6583839.1 hypothetical protein [Pseudanabaena sp. M34BS1SP1A06MG]
MLKKKNLKQLIAIAVVSASSVCSVFADIKPAFANCNLFGCSQSSAAQCNPFGCPKAPAGESCTPFGCPESPRPTTQLQIIQNQPNPSSEQPNPSSEQPNPNSEQPNPNPEQVNPSTQVNPQALKTCLETLLYRTEQQKPFPGWICVPNDVNCRTVKVRTEISENVALQACQGAR